MIWLNISCGRMLFLFLFTVFTLKMVDGENKGKCEIKMFGKGNQFYHLLVTLNKNIFNNGLVIV